MKFGVIYSVDIPHALLEPGAVYRLSEFHPRVLKHKRGTWTQTEKTSEFNNVNPDPQYGLWPHAKFCALLDKEQFSEFVAQFGLSYKSLCDTMGAMGMPGAACWYGIVPAWSFSNDDPNALLNVYVTPWPEVAKKTGKSDREKKLAENQAGYGLPFQLRDYAGN